VISLHRREATTQSTDKGPDAGHAGRHSTMPRQPLTTTPRCYRDGGRRQATTGSADDRAQERLDPRGWGTAGRAPGEGPAHAGVAAAGAPLAAKDPDCTNTMRILTGTPALGFNESINNNRKVDR
jgi:hypothetical protein